MVLFMFAGVIVMVGIIALADHVSYALRLRRTAREHPGQVWTAAGWQDKEPS